MCLADAYLPALPDSLQSALEKAVGQSITTGIRYHLSGPHGSRSRAYILFQPADDTVLAAPSFRLPVALATDLMPHLVSCRYWEHRFAQLLQWSYVRLDKADSLLAFDTLGHLYGHYSPLHLLSYSFSATSPTSPVSFRLTTNTPQPQSLTLDQVQHLAEQGAFASEADLYAYTQQQLDHHRLDLRQRDSLDALLDSLSFWGDLFARQADSIALELEADSVAAERQQRLAEVKRTMQRMSRESLFIFNLKTARSDYMFGLELNLYNCFSRTISRIELTITPYNASGRVQQDKYKRAARDIRCVGPIPPGEPAQFVFDELFWDDSGRIKFMRLTAITFYFTDGTHRSYYGHAQILKHSLVN